MLSLVIITGVREYKMDTSILAMAVIKFTMAIFRNCKHWG
jgi:hypothetical protein